MYTKTFKKISKHDAATAGGKGASLGEMANAKLPVPPGFVLVAGAFEEFIRDTDLDVEIDAALDAVKPDKMHTVEKASETIQELILEAKMPKTIATEITAGFKKLKSPLVAVRSSATAEDSSSAAWAGQLDTYLNTTNAKLLTNVQRCWASLFTPRAIFYRFEKKLHKQTISVAVVVQAMVQSEVSGIAFSVHPVTEDRDQLIIEAGIGLGEAVVSGQITPDSYVVEKSRHAILDKNISDQDRFLARGKAGGTAWQQIQSTKVGKQKLTDKEVLELAKLIIHIEKHYKFPVDVEWAKIGKKFYITQSRPITTLTI